jgi:hypothetical protein
MTVCCHSVLMRGRALLHVSKRDAPALLFFVLQGVGAGATQAAAVAHTHHLARHGLCSERSPKAPFPAPLFPSHDTPDRRAEYKKHFTALLMKSACDCTDARLALFGGVRALLTRVRCGQ